MADGKLELTPVAIQAGKLLAQRLYAGSNELVSGTCFQGIKNEVVKFVLFCDQEQQRRDLALSKKAKKQQCMFCFASLMSRHWAK